MMFRDNQKVLIQLLHIFEYLLKRHTVKSIQVLLFQNYSTQVECQLYTEVDKITEEPCKYPLREACSSDC